MLPPLWQCRSTFGETRRAGGVNHDGHEGADDPKGLPVRAIFGVSAVECRKYLQRREYRSV